MPLIDIKNKIRNTIRSFERRYETNVFFFPENNPPTSIIESRMIDDYHNMILYIELDLSDLTIVDVDVEENKVPFENCPHAILPYKYLIGKQLNMYGNSFEHPFNKKHGCLHINELIDIARQNFPPAYAFFLKEKYYPPEVNEEKLHTGTISKDERREITRHWWMKDRRVKNSCHSFSKDEENPEVVKVVKGIPSFTEMALMNNKENKK